MITQYIKLMRLHQPTGFLLLFWPCSFGLAITNNPRYLGMIPIFLIGSIIMRSAGCIINDIIDRDIDKLVFRTKSRPVASGALSVKQASMLLAILLMLGSFILLNLNLTSIAIGLVSIILIVLYPFMKRLINYPQAFLGITFNTGALISYASIKEIISVESTLVYIACCFWTLGYDTIYGYQDYKHDKKIALKSTSILFEKNHKIFIGVCYISMVSFLISIGLFLKLNIAFYFFMTLVSIQLLWQVSTLDIMKPDDCLKKFNSNKVLGALIFLGFAIGNL